MARAIVTPLKLMIKEKGLKQRDLAKESGVSEFFLSQVINNIRKPTPKI